MYKNIKTTLNTLNNTDNEIINLSLSGWVRNVRTSSNILGFCTINDGSDLNGIQIVISNEFMDENKIADFFKNVKMGCFLKVTGKIILSPSKEQKYEMQLNDFEILGGIITDNYPLSKTKMNLDTLRNNIHLRPRTNTFGSIFRIRSSLMKILHDFYHEHNFLHLDPNIITINECESGSNVFQITENNISKPSELKLLDDKINYDWDTDHFNNPTFLTVSSQLQLEALACSLGNVYTFNKSFRSEHSNTSKHVSEFTHLEIEMINIDINDLMNISETMIKYCITKILEKNYDDIENLNKFVSKGLLDNLNKISNSTFIRLTYDHAVEEINKSCDKKMIHGEDLCSYHENFITDTYQCPVFITQWPFAIKSFYMKQLNNEKCDSFDLLVPFGIGELIGASMREDNYEKLLNTMNIKNISTKNLEFYLDLRRYGSCPHGGFGLGFDRLLMLITGIQNIKDVIPFPVYYKNCKF
jgi:asparaginyl-tRNA synthetase